MRILSKLDAENVVGSMGSRGKTQVYTCEDVVGGLATSVIDIGVGMAAGTIAALVAPEATATAAVSGAAVSPSVIAGGIVTVVSDTTGITSSLGQTFAHSVCPGSYSSWVNYNSGIFSSTGLSPEELLSAF